MTTTLHFLGAAGTVTGSAYLLTTPGGRLLIDCGLFQGPKTLQALNYRALPIAPGEIAAMILTHAHIDHSGLLPRLVAAGFRRRAYATSATCDLLQWLLPDSGAIQEAEVDRLNRRNERRDVAPVKPLYTRDEAEAALDRLVPQELGTWFEPLLHVRARLRNAGHILGSASVELAIAGEDRPLRLLFSGDLGPRQKSLQFDPMPADAADFAVLEATYGDRIRAPMTEGQRRAQLGDEVVMALLAGGNLIIPAFAVERTQELLFDLARLIRDGQIPPAPVYLDSPLARRATEVFETYRSELELPPGFAAPFASPSFHVAETVADSKAIGAVKRGAVIIAGSGMCDAGRVKHHLKDHLWRGDSTVLFVGYQAPGTLGQVIRSGARHVRIHGEEIAVRARIRSLEGYSGHADQRQLVQWIAPILPTVGHVFLTHGEPPALAALADALGAAGLQRARIAVPALGEGFALHAAMPDGTPARAVSVSGFADSRRLETTEAIAAGRDWHNEYAEAALALRRVLADAPDDEARHALLDHVRAALRLPPRGATASAGDAAHAADRAPPR